MEELNIEQIRIKQLEKENKQLKQKYASLKKKVYGDHKLHILYDTPILFEINKGDDLQDPDIWETYCEDLYIDESEKIDKFTVCITGLIW